MYPYIIVLTPEQQNVIALVEGYILIIMLVALILLFTINILHSERIAVLKKTIQMKDVRIAESEQHRKIQRSQLNRISLEKDLKEIECNELKRERKILDEKVKRQNKTLTEASKVIVSSLDSMDASIRKVFLTEQSEPAEVLENKIWGKELEKAV
jgi:hypothetical protein